MCEAGVAVDGDGHDGRELDERMRLEQSAGVCCRRRAVIQGEEGDDEDVDAGLEEEAEDDAAAVVAAAARPREVQSRCLDRKSWRGVGYRG